MTFPEENKLEDYVRNISAVLGKRSIILTVPFYFLLLVSYFLSPLLDFFLKNNPIHPKRIKKLKVSNNVVPKFLQSNGYKFRYSLLESFNDWKKEEPTDW